MVKKLKRDTSIETMAREYARAALAHALPKHRILEPDGLTGSNGVKTKRLHYYSING